MLVEKTTSSKTGGGIYDDDGFDTDDTTPNKQQW